MKEILESDIIAKKQRLESTKPQVIDRMPAGQEILSKCDRLANYSHHKVLKLYHHNHTIYV